MKNILFSYLKASFILLISLAVLMQYSCKDAGKSKSESEISAYHADAAQDSGVARDVLANINADKSELLNKIDKSSANVAAQILSYIESGFPDGKIFYFNNVNFPTGSADISEALRIEVEEVATLMQVYPDLKIKIESHTDNIGDEALNQMLSDLRAGNIKELLMGQFGIEADRIEIVGLGQSKPLVDHETDEGKLKNRRILLYLVK